MKRLSFLLLSLVRFAFWAHASTSLRPYLPPEPPTIECDSETPCGDPSQCCSPLGQCGTDDFACGFGCSSGPCMIVCGDLDILCNSDECCSSFGSCGVGDEYCGTGCLAGACYSQPEKPVWCESNDQCKENECCPYWLGACVAGEEFCSAVPEANAHFDKGVDDPFVPRSCYSSSDCKATECCNFRGYCSPRGDGRFCSSDVEEAPSIDEGVDDPFLPKGCYSNSHCNRYECCILGVCAFRGTGKFCSSDFEEAPDITVLR